MRRLRAIALCRMRTQLPGFIRDTKDMWHHVGHASGGKCERQSYRAILGKPNRDTTEPLTWPTFHWWHRSGYLGGPDALAISARTGRHQAHLPPWGWGRRAARQFLTASATFGNVHAYIGPDTSTP